MSIGISSSAAARANVGASSVRVSPWAFAVGVCVTAYAVYFAIYTCLVHWTFGTLAYDLGTVDQGVWLAGHSRDLFVTVRGLPLLGDHVRPIAFVLAPLYWVWDDVRMLLIAQTLFIAAGAVFLWRIGKLELGERPAWVAVLCVGYLLNPFVQNLNLDHVHPDAFASTFILASLYFLRSARYRPFWVSATLAMACKEDVPLVYVALGMTLLFGPQRRVGLAMMAVASVYFALCIGWILPHFNGVGFFRGRYFLGRTRKQSGLSVLTRLLRLESPTYLYLLGLPLGFCFLFAPVTLVPAFPALFSNLVNETWYPRSPNYHYATSIVPFLYVGAIDALARVARWQSGTTPAQGPALPASGLAHAIPVALLCCAVLANLEYAKVPLNKLSRIVGVWRLSNTEVNTELHAVLNRIPRDAAVSADFTLVPHLSHRRRIYMFPNPFVAEQWGVHLEQPHDPSTIDYIVVRPGVAANKQRKVLGPLLESGAFVRQGSEKNVNVYVRVMK